MSASTERPPPHAGPLHAPGGLLARNSVLNLAGFGVALAVGILSMPAIARGLGSERFGLLGLVWGALAFLNLMDLGLARATTKFAADVIARKDTESLRDIAGVAALVQTAASVLGGIALALAAPLIVEQLRISPALRVEATWSFVALAAAAPAVILTNTFIGLLEAAQRFDVVNLVRAPTSTANFLVPLAGALLGWSVVGIVAGILVVRVIALAVYAAACLRFWPVLGSPLRVERARAKQLLGFGGWIAVSSFVSPLLTYIDRFVIGALVTVAAVGFYAAPQEMVTRLYIVPSSIVGTLFPAFAALTATAGVAMGAGGIERMMVGGAKYLLALLAPVLIALALLSADVLELWLGGDFAEQSATALALLSIGMLVNSLAFLPSALIQAAGRPDLTAKFHLLELPIHLVVLWLMVREWGISGAAAAWSIRVGLDAALLYGASIRMGAVRPASFLGLRLPTLVASLVVLALAGAIVVTAADTSAWRIGGVAAVTAIWALWAVKALLDETERAQLRLALSRRRNDSAIAE